jgi:hypothetical protein
LQRENLGFYPVNSHNTKELWSAVEIADGSSENGSISDLGSHFDDLDAMNCYFPQLPLILIMTGKEFWFILNL